MIKEYDNLGTTLLGTFGSGVLSVGTPGIACACPNRSRLRRAARCTSPTPATGESSGSQVAVLPRCEFGRIPGSRGPRRADRDRRRLVRQRVHHEEGHRSDPEVRRRREPLGGVRRDGQHEREVERPEPPSRSVRTGTCTSPTQPTSGSRSSTRPVTTSVQWGSAGTSDQASWRTRRASPSARAGTSTSLTRGTTGSKSSQRRASSSEVGSVRHERRQLQGAEGDQRSMGPGTCGSPTAATTAIQKFSPTGTFLAKVGAYRSAATEVSRGRAISRSTRRAPLGGRQGPTTGSSGSRRRARYLSQLGGRDRSRHRQFSAPLGIAIDSAGRILVTDSINNRVQVFEDKNGPDTTITGPASSTPSSSASFTFTANEPGATFHCKLDGGSYAPCTSSKTYTRLVEGSHTLLRLCDGFASASTGTRHLPWTIDTTPPIGEHRHANPRRRRARRAPHSRSRRTKATRRSSAPGTHVTYRRARPRRHTAVWRPAATCST